MELIRNPELERLERVGILAGGFNPPTVAHLELARAALQRVDAVLFVLPRVFPHEKDFQDVSLEDRLQMLAPLLSEPRFGLAIAERGLFIEIARETRALFGGLDLWFLCGTDAASRIVNWDYGEPHAFQQMLEEFGLLVSRRMQVYEPPPEYAHRIELLPAIDLDEVSSTEVRERIRTNRQWRQLVPEKIQRMVEKLYR